MNLKKKILKGGYDNIVNIKMQNFLSIIIIGYFGIKIVYGLFFNFYPEKYYYRSIDITSNDKNIVSEEDTPIKKITTNAFVPGVWNSEITDFVSLLVLTYIIFVFTNFTGKSCTDENGNLSLPFLMGYIVGLGYPAFKKTYETNTTSSLTNYSIYGLFFIFTVFIIIMNFISAGNKINYIIFIVTIVLLIYALFATRKISKSYSTVSYNYNNGESCTYNKVKDTAINKSDGIIETSGDKLKITVPFVAFIILLLFSYEPSEISMQTIYIFIYALLLGIFVSGVSYYGIEYFLEKKPLKECNNFKDCMIKNMVSKKIRNILEEENDIDRKDKIKFEKENGNLNIKNNLKETGQTNNSSKKENNFVPLNLILLLLLLLLSLYLIFYYLKNRIL